MKSRTSKYSDTERQEVINLRESGMKIKDICEKTGMSATVVYGIVRNDKRRVGPTTEPQIVRLGRPAQQSHSKVSKKVRILLISTDIGNLKELVNGIGI